MRDLQGTLLTNSIFARMEYCVCVCVCERECLETNQSRRPIQLRQSSQREPIHLRYILPHTHTGWLHQHILMQKTYGIQMTQLKWQMGHNSYLWEHVTRHLCYWKNSSEVSNSPFSLRNTGDNLRVKNRFLQNTCQAWLVVWLSGNERGFMLIPAGSESGHRGMSVFFFPFFL